MMLLLKTVLICFCLVPFIATPAEGRFGGLIRIIVKFFKGVHHAIHHGGHVLDFMNENREFKDSDLDPGEEDAARKLIDEEITDVVKDLLESNSAKAEDTIESNLQSKNPEDFVNRPRETNPPISDSEQL